MATWKDYLLATRPLTLWTAVCPVVIGSAYAAAFSTFQVGFAILCLLVALLLQIGANFANDYADGVRGTDANRIGPERLVASGKARPTLVKNIAWGCFAAAAGVGLLLTIWSGKWWFLLVGAVAIVAAWTYTASARPYGYYGWGEVAVFVFYGPVAVFGTVIAQSAPFPGDALIGLIFSAVGVGSYAVALLLINNIRDLELDRLAGKKTLAVKLGVVRATLFCGFTMVLPPLLAFIQGFYLDINFVLTGILLLGPSAFLSVGVWLRRSPNTLRRVFLGLGIIAYCYAGLTALAWINISG